MFWLNWAMIRRWVWFIGYHIVRIHAGFLSCFDQFQIVLCIVIEGMVSYIFSGGGGTQNTSRSQPIVIKDWYTCVSLNSRDSRGDNIKRLSLRIRKTLQSFVLIGKRQWTLLTPPNWLTLTMRLASGNMRCVVLLEVRVSIRAASTPLKASPPA